MIAFIPSLEHRRTSVTMLGQINVIQGPAVLHLPLPCLRVSLALAPAALDSLAHCFDADSS